MKKITTSLALVLGLSTLAATSIAASPVFPPLDKVSYQLSAEQWATTTSAKVFVTINATLNESQLSTIHADILANLNKINSVGQWHITQFNRNKSDSGLEQVTATAEARLPASALANLRKSAETVSKPGVTYKISGIDFSPSEAEIQSVKADLRAKIYAETKQELERINKAYPKENYFLHSINFEINTIEPQPMVRANVLMD